MAGDGLAVSLFDYETGLQWSHRGDRWFHSASTIKVAVLLALFGAIDAGRFTLDSRLHVRNRFLSLVDGTPFRVVAGPRRGQGGPRRHRQDDADRRSRAAHDRDEQQPRDEPAGRSRSRSSRRSRCSRATASAASSCARGVEDDKAFEANFNNRVTANGLVALFRVIHERRGVLPESAREMLDILFQQEFRSGIPAGLPAECASAARIANKTGEISVARTTPAWCFCPAASRTCSPC